MGSYSRDDRGKLYFNQRGRNVVTAIGEARYHHKFGELFSAGEPKAHQQIATKYAVTFAYVAGACAPSTERSRCDIHGPSGAIFVIVGIGDAGDTGVNFTRAQLDRWRSQNAHCKDMSRGVFTVK